MNRFNLQSLILSFLHLFCRGPYRWASDSAKMATSDSARVQESTGAAHRARSPCLALSPDGATLASKPRRDGTIRALPAPVQANAGTRGGHRGGLMAPPQLGASAGVHDMSLTAAAAAAGEQRRDPVPEGSRAVGALGSSDISQVLGAHPRLIPPPIGGQQGARPALEKDVACRPTGGGGGMEAPKRYRNLVGPVRGATGLRLPDCDTRCGVLGARTLWPRYRALGACLPQHSIMDGRFLRSFPEGSELRSYVSPRPRASLSSGCGVHASSGGAHHRRASSWQLPGYRRDGYGDVSALAVSADGLHLVVGRPHRSRWRRQRERNASGKRVMAAVAAGRSTGVPGDARDVPAWHLTWTQWPRSCSATANGRSALRPAWAWAVLLMVLRRWMAPRTARVAMRE